MLQYPRSFGGVIAHVVLAGVAGDLAGRFLLPALAALHAGGRLPEDLRVVGVDVRDWDDDDLRRHAAQRLERHAAHVPAHSRNAVIRALRYAGDDIATAVRAAGDDAPLAVYLAIPQHAFAPAVQALAGTRLPPGSRIAIEKPFGEDLQGARELNALLARVAAEEKIMRVDHVLAMPVTQRLIARRIEDEPGWDAAHVAEVEILWEETIALEGRAGFYDRAGALRDVLQNHMLQLLSLVAMEPPRGEADLPARKLEALRATSAAGPSRRARYAGYAEEEGVDPRRGTETFAEVLMQVDTERWAPTPFRLRAGKALAHGFKGVILHGRDGARTEIEVDRLGEGEPPAYAHVLGSLLDGSTALSVRGEEAEEAWRIVTPVLDAWARGEVPLEEYPRGSPGPPRL
jgi:glucose-6-phosphate 1-dehydrogenase